MNKTTASILPTQFLLSKKPLLAMLVISLVVLAIGRVFFPEPRLVFITQLMIDEQLAITRSKNRMLLDEDDRQKLIDAMIERQMILDIAIDMGLDDSPKVTARLAQLLKQIDQEPDETMTLALKDQALKSDSTLQDYLINDWHKITDEQLSITPPAMAQINNYYEKNVDTFSTPERRTIRHVFFKQPANKKTISLLRSQLTSEKINFEDAYVLGDPFMQGYYFNGLTLDQLTVIFGKAFANAAFSAESGLVIGPVESAIGEHLFIVEHVFPRRRKPIEQVSSMIKNQLIREQLEIKRKQLLRELAKKTIVHLPKPYQVPPQYQNGSAES